MTFSSVQVWAAVLAGMAAAFTILVRIHMMINGVMRALDELEDHERRIRRLEHHTHLVQTADE